MTSDDHTAWKLTRSKILLGCGLLGTAHETVVAASPRPYLLLLFASMMGLASFLKLDDLLASRKFRITLDTPNGQPTEDSTTAGGNSL